MKSQRNKTIDFSLEQSKKYLDKCVMESETHTISPNSIVIGDAYKALEKVMIAKENIVHIPNAQTTAFLGEDKLTAIEYQDRENGEIKHLEVPAVFVAIGQVPENEIFAPFAELDEQGYFIANENMSTKTEGFFVAGDCRKKGMRQVVTAVSDGAVAGVSASLYVEKYN